MKPPYESTTSNDNMNHRELAFGVPGDINTATGGYAYNRKIMSELTQAGWKVVLVALGDGFPDPDDVALSKAHQKLMAVAPGTPLVVDGLALGVMPETAKALSKEHTLIALVHHPLALESGLSKEKIARLKSSETRSLEHAKHVIVTSGATAKIVKDFGVTEDRLSVVIPGTEVLARAPKVATTMTELLSVGTITHRKGFDILIKALALLKSLNWHLTIVGDTTRDDECARQVDQLIHQHQLQTRITIAGVLSEADLSERYAGSDVFVLASRFEGYGMAYTEAMAHGLPIIGTTAGAIADTVTHQAGLLVAPDSVEELAKALKTMLNEPKTRENYAKEAKKTASFLPSWQASAALFAEVILAI
jgi:glycosyltransferase involved in cell wall biosynthesis